LEPIVSIGTSDHGRNVIIRTAAIPIDLHFRFGVNGGGDEIAMTKLGGLLAIAIIVVTIGAAFIIRADEQGYITYMGGDPAAAIPGLTTRAERGDTHAAILLGSIYQPGPGSVPPFADRRKAAAWYLKGAQMGDLRAVRLFINMRLGEGASASPARQMDRCNLSIRLLNMAAAAGDAGANIMLGSIHRDGNRCVPSRILKAAQYFNEAASLDPKLSSFIGKFIKKNKDIVRASLASPFPGNAKRPTPAEALQEFIAAVPALGGAGQEK